MTETEVADTEVADAEEELDLSTLSDEELVEQMHDDLYDGLREEIEEGTNILLERGWAPDKLLANALVEGMRIVGIDFRDGILFVPEVPMPGPQRSMNQRRYGDPASATGGNWCGKYWYSGDWHGKRRYPRYRQESREYDAGGGGF